MKHIFTKTYIPVMVGLLCASLNFAQENESSKPNVIFILVDDMGIGDVGVYFQNQRKANNKRSEPWLETQYLDALAGEGAMLTNHYVGAPVCAPSRASLLTGLNQGHTNVRNNQFDKAIADDFTLGNVMQRAGYTTAAIGKWGLQGKGSEYPDWPAHPSKRGFDYYYGYISHGQGHEHYPKEGVHKKKADVWENYTNVVEDLDKCYTGDLWTAVAKRWIVEQTENNKQPFFIYLAYDTPHAVWELPTSAYPQGGGLNGGMQWLGTPGNMISSAKGEVDSWFNPLYENQTWDDDNNPNTPEVAWPESYKRYATSITRIDEQVGDIFQLLKDLNIADNTILVFTSDNGPSKESYLKKEIYGGNTPDFFDSFANYDGIKRDVWHGGVLVPTIVVWPNHIKENLIINEPSAFYDWLPTLTEVAGYPKPAFTSGKSILPLLNNEETKEDRSVYIEYSVGKKTPNYKEFDPAHRGRKRGQMQMLRIGDTLAIRYNIETPADDFEIYDVSVDSKQTNNLAKTNDLSELQKRLKQEILKRRIVNETAPRPYDKVGIQGVSISDSEASKLAWKFTEGNYLWLSDDANLTINNSGEVSALSNINLPKEDEGIVQVSGYFYAKENGFHELTVPAKMQIIYKMYDANVLNNDFRANKDGEVSGIIKLKKGYHPFKLYVYKNKGESINWSNLTWKMGQLKETPKDKGKKKKKKKKNH